MRVERVMKVLFSKEKTAEKCEEGDLRSVVCSSDLRSLTTAAALHRWGGGSVPLVGQLS